MSCTRPAEVAAKRALDEQVAELQARPCAPLTEIDPDAPLWELIMPNNGAVSGCGSISEWIGTFTDVMNRIADDDQRKFKKRRHDIGEFKKSHDDTIDRIKTMEPDIAEQFGKDYKRLLRRLSAQAKEAGE